LVTQQKLDYIHQNPIRAGIVNKAEEYIYFSAANYAGMKGVNDVDLL
jgi:putative transposase